MAVENVILLIGIALTFGIVIEKITHHFRLNSNSRIYCHWYIIRTRISYYRIGAIAPSPVTTPIIMPQ